MKSVFKFDEHIKIYELKLTKDSLHADNRGFDTIYIDGYEIISKDDSVINHKYKYDIELPKLHKDELFYLEDVDMFVRINNSIRTSNNGMVYICYDINTSKDEGQHEKLREERNKKNKELIKQYIENKPVGVLCTPSFSEPEVKKGFFANLAKLFSR